MLSCWIKDWWNIQPVSKCRISPLEFQYNTLDWRKEEFLLFDRPWSRSQSGRLWHHRLLQQEGSWTAWYRCAFYCILRLFGYFTLLNNMLQRYHYYNLLLFINDSFRKFEEKWTSKFRRLVSSLPCIRLNRHLYIQDIRRRRISCR